MNALIPCSTTSQIGKKEGAMKLREKLDAFRKNFKKQVLPKALKIIHRATDDLRNSDIMDRAVKVGDKEPDSTLKTPATMRFY